MSINGSFIGCAEARVMTYLPPARRSTANLTDSSAGFNSMLAWRKASLEPSFATRLSASPRCRETTSISALSGCPNVDNTDILPSPAAQAIDGSSAIPTSAKAHTVFEANFPTCHPEEPSGNKLKYHHGLSLAS
jgi:hypothetical protein